MKHTLLAVSSSLLLLAPLAASAHEHQAFEIGGKTYEFTIGSLNEPVTVDDKTGVELAVGLVGDHAEDPDHVDGDEHAAATPVTGLEQTLKVELQAGGKKKELPRTTQYGKPGSYKAVFFPTVATTYTYRVFGTIAGTPVDISFTCNPAGHPATPEDTSRVEISDGVARINKAGAFGCPAAKADLGFPEPAPTLQDVSADGGTSGLSAAALGLSAAAMALAAGAMAKGKKQNGMM